MVEQKDGVASLTVKVHMDDMKRVTIREQVNSIINAELIYKYKYYWETNLNLNKTFVSSHI